MFNLKRYFLLGAIIFITFVSYSSAKCDDDETSRSTLKGLKAVFTLVDSLRSDVSEHGLTINDLRTDIELKLRLANIAVLSDDDSIGFSRFENHICGLRLYVNIIPSKTQVYYIYNILLEAIQGVSLIRNPEITSPAPTWYVGTLGGTSSLNDVRDESKSVIDQFINAYLSANPKENK